MNDKILKCNGCGSFLTDEVENCPNCGCSSKFFIVFEEKNETEEAPAEKKDKKKHEKKKISKKRKIIGFCILALIVVVLVIGLIYEDKAIKERRSKIDLYDVLYSDNPNAYYAESDGVISYIDKQNRVYVTISDECKFAHIDKENASDYDYTKENYSISGIHLGDDINSINSSKYSLVDSEQVSNFEEYIYDDLNNTDAYLRITTDNSKIIILEYIWTPGSDDDYKSELSEKTTEAKQAKEQNTTERQATTEKQTTTEKITTTEAEIYSSDYINDLLDSWVAQGDVYSIESMGMTTMKFQMTKFCNDYGIGYLINFDKYDESSDNYYYISADPYSYDGSTLYCISSDGYIFQIVNNYDGSIDVISDTVFSGTYWNVNLF